MPIHQRLVEAIREMCAIDQELRFMAKPEKSLVNYVIYVADQAHNARIRRLIDEFGYPTSESVGQDALEDFWLVVQHQDSDVRLQEACLKSCDFAPKQRAFLTDRVLVNMGELQLYGTQLQRDADRRKVPKPIREAEHLESRRKEMGLEPLSEYLEYANSMP